MTARVQTSGSPDYDACGLILRQHGNSGADWAQLRAAEDCLRGGFVALFLLLSIWKESASEMTKNRKTKFTQRKRKGPSLRHITHIILKASNKNKPANQSQTAVQNTESENKYPGKTNWREADYWADPDIKGKELAIRLWVLLGQSWKSNNGLIRE